MKLAMTAKDSIYSHRLTAQQDIWAEKKHLNASAALIHARKLLDTNTLHLSPAQTSYIGATLLHLMLTQAVVPMINADPMAWKAVSSGKYTAPTESSRTAFYDPIPWQLHEGLCRTTGKDSRS